MDLNRVYYFVSVVEAGSYTAAGERLRMPKSTLSRQIKALEDDLEIRLLNRSTRKINLTPSGEKFYKDCLPLVTHLQNAHSQLVDSKEQVSGQLRVTLSAEFAQVFLSGVIAEFMTLHPQVFLDFDMSSLNHDLIQEGFDLALRIGDLQDSSYIAKRLITMNIGLYAAPDYLNKHGRLSRLDDLVQHQMVMLGGVERQAQWFGEGLADQIKSQLSSNNVLFNRSMCEQGLGIALLPKGVAKPSLEAGSIEAVLPDKFNIEVPLYAVYPSRKHPTKVMLSFIEFVSNQLSIFKDSL